MVKVLILGQGYVASTFVAGLEKLRKGEIEPYGVPLQGNFPSTLKTSRLWEATTWTERRLERN